MFGVLRLGLALIVMLVHLTWSPVLLPIGVGGVIVFFILSGYAMSGLADRWRFVEQGRIRRYMLDRIARIMPQYLFWLLLAACLAGGFGIWPMLVAAVPLSVPTLLLNATLLPVMLGRVSEFGVHAPLLPQAWTLGSEMSFYAMLPLLVLSRRLALLLTGLSLAVFACAILGQLKLMEFGYIAPFGTFAFFVLGWAMHRRDHRLAIGIVGLALSPLLLSWLRGTLGNHAGPAFDVGLLLGVAFGPPLLLLAERGARLPAVLDRQLGNLSYGVYLAHNAVIAVLLRLQCPHRLLGVAVVLLTLAAAQLGWSLIDHPIERWRRALRHQTGPCPASLDSFGSSALDPRPA